MKNRKNQKISKTLSLLLALAMVFAILPGVAVAEEESTGPVLKTTNEIKWIDRLADIPQYASDFYAWLEENSNGNGTQDALIDPTGAPTATINNETANVYLADSNEFSTEFTLQDGQNYGDVATAWAQDLVDTRFAAVSAWLGAVYQAFARDHPEVFWLSGSSRTGSYCSNISISGDGTNYTASFSMEIYFVLSSDSFDIREEAYKDADTVRTAIEARDAAVETVLSAINEDSSLQEKVTYLNDWLTKNNCYNSDASTAGKYAHSCLSALTGNTGADGPVCEGYAKAFKVLCDALEIPCVLVDGTAMSSANATGEAHMWNCVQMEDGWYAVDVTWNDPVVSGAEPAKVSGSEREDYLLVGSTTLINEQTFEDSHTVKNQLLDEGLSFTNGPVLNSLKYGGVINLADNQVIEFVADSTGKYYTIDEGDKVYYSGRITIKGSGSQNGCITFECILEKYSTTHYITLDNVSLTPPKWEKYSPVHLNGHSSVDLNLVGSNYLNGSSYTPSEKIGKPGVYVDPDADVTIGGTGSLTAEAVHYAAGIGGGTGSGWWDCGAITINSGTITAIGCEESAGIGSAGHGATGDITINGGVVTTQIGTNWGNNSIGSGMAGAKSKVTINGGTVTATGWGGQNIASIGGSSITINGGTVYAPYGLSTTATNSSGDKLTLTEITLSGVSAATEIAEIAYGDTEYGTKDVYTADDGKLYLYLPAGTLPTITTSDGSTYIVGSSGTAYMQKADPEVEIAGKGLVLSQDGDLKIYTLDGESHAYTGTMTVIGASYDVDNTTVTVSSGAHEVLLQSEESASYVHSFTVASDATANVTVNSKYYFYSLENKGTMTLGGSGTLLSSQSGTLDGTVVTNSGTMTISGPLQVGNGANGYAVETKKGASLCIQGSPSLQSGSDLVMIYCNGSALDLSQAECNGWTVELVGNGTALTVGENVILPDTQWGLVDADGNEVTTVEMSTSSKVTVRNPKTAVEIAVTMNDLTYDGKDHRDEIVITVNEEDPLDEHTLSVTYTYSETLYGETTVVTEIKNAGHYTVTVSIPANNVEYSAETVTATFQIEQLELTVVPDDITIDRGDELKLTYKVYEGAVYSKDQLPEKEYEGGLLSAEDVWLSTDGTSTSPDGTYTISASVDDPNFYVSTYLTGTLTVNCEKDHAQADTYDDDGFCTVCGGYEPAVLNENDPENEWDDLYEISNAGQLYWFAYQVNNVNNGISGKLMNNITIPATVGQDEASKIPDWTPIIDFNGTFDGNGKTVSGLYCKSEGEQVGMFGGGGYSYGIIKDLNLTKCYFEGTERVGGLAGYHAGIIENCSVDGTVTVVGTNFTGILVGRFDGTMSNCYAYAAVLIGSYSSDYATVTNCYYLSETDDGNGGKTAAQFASGEVAYLLQEGIVGETIYDEDGNESGTTEPEHVWGQTIGKNTYPVLGGDKVYQVTCGGSVFYSNTNQSYDAHNYVDHRCTACGAIEKFQIAGARMSLGNTLDMQFAFRQDHLPDWTGAYAVIVKTGASGNTVTKTIYCSDWTEASNVDSAGNKHHVITFDGIAAKEMTDDVTVTVYNAAGEAISQTYADSVKNYAMRLLNGKTEMDEVAILLVDMLNYGAAAETFFTYEAEDPANAGLTEDQKGWATPDVTYDNKLVEGTNYYGSRLVLASNIRLQIAFKNMDPEKMYAVYSFTDHRGNAHEVKVLGSSFVYDEEYGVYAVPIEEIVLSDARQLVTVTVYNSDESVYATASDSVESYIARMSDTDALYETIMKFAISAYNYFHE